MTLRVHDVDTFYGTSHILHGVSLEMAGGELFATTHTFLVSSIGLVLLFGWSVAFFYHLCNGVRHLAWDAGYGFELRSAARSGYAVLAATVLLTAMTWLYVFLA